jgi:hypothetical protein
MVNRKVSLFTLQAAKVYFYVRVFLNEHVKELSQRVMY